MDIATKEKRPAGMAGFIIVWAGQMISVLATNMTGFGLTIWMYQQTESVTAMGLMQVAFITPFLLLSPIAGAMVDRYDRKLMMMVSDLAAGLSTLMVFVLFATGEMQFWHLYIANAIAGIGNTFQWPAYSAAISTMVPKEQYGRANGMMSLIEAGPGVLAPMLAGALLPIIDLNGILLIDIVTFLLAIGALLIVFIPKPEVSEESQHARGNLWQEGLYGFRYIFKRPGLLGLQIIFLFGNLFFGIAFTNYAPMILARTNSNTLIFGTVQTAGAIGGVVGGVLLSVWGGFKRRIIGVVGGWMAAGLILAGLGLSQGVIAWSAFMVFIGIVSALMNTSNQAIWQSIVAPDLQGRVFSARRLIAWVTNPISPLIAGTLADFVFEPAMQSGGSLAEMLGGVFGTEPGSGMSLIMFLCGAGVVLIGFIGFLFEPIRNVETQARGAEVQPEVGNSLGAEQ